jgi:hypothetical protein
LAKHDAGHVGKTHVIRHRVARTASDQPQAAQAGVGYPVGSLAGGVVAEFGPAGVVRLEGAVGQQVGAAGHRPDFHVFDKPFPGAIEVQEEIVGAGHVGNAEVLPLLVEGLGARLAGAPIRRRAVVTVGIDAFE